MLEAPRDALGIDLDADGDPAVQRHGKRLRPAHPPKAGGQCDRPRKRSAEPLARHGGECFVRPLQDALRSDVDPRAGGHLAVHRQSERFEAAELVPRRPLRNQHRVGDQDPGRPLVRLEDSDRLARLHQQRLVALETAKLADDGVEGLPRTGGAAGAAVHDKVFGTLGHLRVEVVHQHAHRGLLRPAEARDVLATRGPNRPSPPRSPGRGRVGRSAHLRVPTTDSAASTIEPPRMSASAAASSGATTRSGPTPATCLRSAARTAPVAGDGSRGRRSSCARAAAHSSTARMWATLSRTVRSFNAAPQPIETWSSCIPDVGTESTLAGAASRRFSATSAAAVYWATMRPEFTPGSSARKGGRPCERCGSRSRSTRRSAIDPTSAAAMARKSAAKASGSPWKLPFDSTSPFSITIGLSIVDESSTSAIRRTKSSVSRAAPATCGLQRTEYESWTACCECRCEATIWESLINRVRLAALAV